MESVATGPDDDILLNNNHFLLSNDIWFWRILLIVVIVLLFLFINKLSYAITDDMTKHMRYDLIRHLNYLDNLFNKYKIKHWLTHDTLFSVIRLKRLLKSNTDFCLGVDVKDLNKILELNDILKKDGYTLRKVYIYGVDIKSKKEKYIWKLCLKLSYGTHENLQDIGNIFCYKFCDDSFVRRFDDLNKVNYLPSLNTFPSWFVDKLDIIKIDESSYFVPRDYDKLLEYWYGSKWKTLNIMNDNFGDPDIDYSIKRSLSVLINYMKTKNINLVPSKNYCLVTFPDNEIEWMEKNDTIKIK